MSPTKFAYDRIDKNDVVLLIVDHQEGLYQIARDFSAVDMRSNILAHATLGKIFNLPVIMTSSSDSGKYTRCWALDIILTLHRPQRSSSSGNHRHVPERAVHPAPGRS